MLRILEFMKNKPLLHDMMKTLYLLKKSKHITSFQSQVILIDYYDIKKTEYKDNQMICHQIIDGKKITTSIPI
jgi:hypothetical protein